MPLDYHFVDKTKCSNTAAEIIQAAWDKDWIFSWETWTLLVFYKKRKAKTVKRKIADEEPLFYNKEKVRWLCHYAFDDDFLELYKIWRSEKKLNPKNTIFTEHSEKLLFGKFNKEPKKVGLKMLENAIEWKWIAVHPLHEVERNKIIEVLRKEKEIEEKRYSNFSSQEKEKIELDKKRKINEVLIKHPKLDKQARDEISKKYPNMKWWAFDATVYAKKRILANKILENEEQNKK